MHTERKLGRCHIRRDETAIRCADGTIFGDKEISGNLERTGWEGNKFRLVVKDVRNLMKSNGSSVTDDNIRRENIVGEWYEHPLPRKDLIIRTCIYSSTLVANATKLIPVCLNSIAGCETARKIERCPCRHTQISAMAEFNRIKRPIAVFRDRRTAVKR
jgi:hypothetical protein